MSSVSQITRPSRSLLRRELAVLATKYPGGLDWLDRRLDDVEAGRAGLWQISKEQRGSGWAIVTPKGHRAAKLSTFYIAPHARGAGLGPALLEAIIADWQDREVAMAHVTMDESDHATRRFFQRHGFALLPCGCRAYGSRFDCTYALSLDDAARGETGYWPSFPMSGESQVRSRFMLSSAS